MKALIAPNVFAALPSLIWFYLFIEQADRYAKLPAYGYSGTWDLEVYFSLAMLLILLISMVIFTFVIHRQTVIVAIASVALFLLLPYGFMMGGGI